jgi:hypothetical protein
MRTTTFFFAPLGDLSDRVVTRVWASGLPLNTETPFRRHAETLLPYLGLGGFIRARMWRFLAS